jgi:hypothetical protein
MAASSSLDVNIRKILSRWTKEGFYVYLRPITSKYIDARSDHSVYWNVQVEFRTVPPGIWRAEGYSLDDCILELDAKVPRTRKAYKQKMAGWMAPESVLKKEIKRFRKEAEARATEQFEKAKKKNRSKKRPVDELSERRKKKAKK